jgi:hypothetical protein
MAHLWLVRVRRVDRAIAATTRLPTPSTPSTLRPRPTPSGSTLSGGCLPPGNPLRPGAILTRMAAGENRPDPHLQIQYSHRARLFTLWRPDIRRKPRRGQPQRPQATRLTATHGSMTHSGIRAGAPMPPGLAGPRQVKPQLVPDKEFKDFYRPNGHW